MIDTTKQESFGKEKTKYREELFMKRKLLGVLLCAAVTTTMFAGCGDGG